jgi:pimeloyl-ACP methyl ester carboxylesterase
MERARSPRHSGLYYRNTAIVWIVTILVFWIGLAGPRHWISMLLFLLGLYLVFILWGIYSSVHPGRSIFRRRIPSFEVDLECEKVRFLSRDGLRLSGYFIAGKKRQVIILVHGLRGTGLALSSQARMFSKAGYSVFMPELRGHGDSDGDTITGVQEINDIIGAIEYLESRPDVDANQIGILGVSFGAIVALKAAAEIKSIRAVVLESIGPATLSDHGGRPKTLKRWINYPYNWLLYKLFNFMCGVEVEEGVIDSLHLIYPRPILFIATGRGKERYFMRMFFEAARQPKTILEVPKASHGIAYAVDSREYRNRVLKIFDQALG